MSTQAVAVAGSVDPIAEALGHLGEEPLTEERVAEHIFPLFRRVLDRDEIYLSNHSLGRPPDRMAEDVRRGIDAWYMEMDAAWSIWLEEHESYRASIAALIGCSNPNAIAPKTSAGQALRAVLNALPNHQPRVVATRGEFDSIDFVLKTYAAKNRIEPRWVEGDEHGYFHAGRAIAEIDAGVDLVVISQVMFVTGQVMKELGAVIDAAHEAGALVLMDTYHSAGAMPVGFDRLGPDFAIGGNYKYTRGGPGACWLAIHPRHFAAARTPSPGDLATLDTGWFAKEEPLAFGRSPEAVLAPGGDAWLEATPPVLTYFQAKAGLDVTLGIGVDRIRKYNCEQQAFLVDQLRSHGVEPTLFEPRGAFLLVHDYDAFQLSARLSERGVNTDARCCPVTGRGYVRLCPDILTTRDEMARAAEIFADTRQG